MGLVELLPHLPLLRRRLRETTAWLRREPPDVLVTIDAPGFCLRLAEQLKGTKHSPPALCGAVGLGLEAGAGAEAGASGGSSAGAASLRAALFHAPWPGLHLCRPSRAGDHGGHPGGRGVPAPAWHRGRGAAALRAARQPAVRAEPAAARSSPRRSVASLPAMPDLRVVLPTVAGVASLAEAGAESFGVPVTIVTEPAMKRDSLCRQRRRARGLRDGCGRTGGRRHAGRHRLSRQSDFRRHRPAHDQGQIRIPGEPAARPRRDAGVPAGELPAGEAGRGARPAAQRSGGPRRRSRPPIGEAMAKLAVDGLPSDRAAAVALSMIRTS